MLDEPLVERAPPCRGSDGERVSGVAAAAGQLDRAVADFDTALRASETWRDDQRLRLERAQLAPLRAAANQYRAALRDLDASLDEARRLLQA